MGKRFEVVTAVSDVVKAEALAGILRDSGIPAAFHVDPRADHVPIFVPARKARHAAAVIGCIDDDGALCAVGPAAEPQTYVQRPRRSLLERLQDALFVLIDG